MKTIYYKNINKYYEYIVILHKINFRNYISFEEKYYRLGISHKTCETEKEVLVGTINTKN